MRLAAPSPLGGNRILGFYGPHIAPATGHWGNFEIISGDGTLYHHIEAIGGAQTEPTWSHAYDYPIEGHGLPAKFHLLDQNGKTRDNYGQLDIRIRAADANDCERYGIPEAFRSFGFDSLAACKAYMYSEAQAADTYTQAVTVAATRRSAKARR